MIVILTWMVDTIETILKKLLPKYRASRFYEDCRRLYVRGDHGFNTQVRELLKREYGYTVDI